MFFLVLFCVRAAGIPAGKGSDGRLVTFGPARSAWPGASMRAASAKRHRFNAAGEKPGGPDEHK